MPEGNYAQLKALIARIEGPPNNLQENLRAAAACGCSGGGRALSAAGRALSFLY